MIATITIIGYLAIVTAIGIFIARQKQDSAVDTASWWSFVGLGWLPVIAMFFSATVHTPAASVYVNYSSSARQEKLLVPAFLLAGVIACVMPFLSGVIGIEAVARYGVDLSIRSYGSITQVATDAGQIVGGIALAAILAALISSGGPILLASSTLFVNDWLPGSKAMSGDARLRAYRMTSVIYGLVAATIAALANISSVLELLLLGYAMVVPPAVVIGFILYWKRTTEQGAFLGIALGYATGLIAWFVNEWMMGGPDPSYWTTLVPLIVTPIVSVMTKPGADPLAEPFYKRLSTPS